MFFSPWCCEWDSTDLQMKSKNSHLKFYSPRTTTAKFYMKSFRNFLCIYKYMYRSILLLPPYPPPPPSFFCFTQRGSLFHVSTFYHCEAEFIKPLDCNLGVPRWLSSKEFTWKCWRQRFDPRVRKIPSRRKWQPNPVFLPRKSHGQKSLAGYRAWGRKERLSSVQFSGSVVSNSLQLYGSQHARPSCSSPTPDAYSNSHLLCQWCHPTISSSVVPFSSCLNLSQHQGLFKWVSSSHQVARVL